jgi:hypothetical protein
MLLHLKGKEEGGESRRKGKGNSRQQCSMRKGIGGSDNYNSSEGMVASVLWGGQTANTMCEEGSEEPPGGRDHVVAKSGNEWCLAAIMLKQRGKGRGWGSGHGGATWRRVGRGVRVA